MTRRLGGATMLRQPCEQPFDPNFLYRTRRTARTGRLRPDHRALDASGYYTYAIAAPSDLPSVVDPTVTVLPWGDTTVPKKVLFLRYMMPLSAFVARGCAACQDDAAG
ncbi:hypothetical protein [Rhodococcus sp. As11]|uniref:hypothetical protein n=1 Tax=Rhodococcus sp. As11 TaxID=3029189 RepID=UPI003B781CD5